VSVDTNGPRHGPAERPAGEVRRWAFGIGLVVFALAWLTVGATGDVLLLDMARECCWLAI
jgi:hypothetical protein